MSDRRRINGPGGPTYAPVFDEELCASPVRKRSQNDARPFFLKTGVTPSASGSAYLEMERSDGLGAFGMKLACTVHGPRSLPRNAPFSPHMVLSTHVKYAPFATVQRKGYLRDASERDLSVHLEAALRGAVIADRWPKSAVDVIVTVIEGDLTRQTIINEGFEEWTMMTVLSGCTTVAAAAMADAGIDCVDRIAGGVAALVAEQSTDNEPFIVLDPVVSEHMNILAACCVAYLPTRDEITNIWYKGCLSPTNLEIHRSLVAKAILASKGTSQVISSSLLEALRLV